MTDKLPTFDMDLDDSMEVDMVDSPARQSQEDLYKRVHRRIIFEVRNSKFYKSIMNENSAVAKTIE